VWKKTAKPIKSSIENANKLAMEKMKTSKPFLVDIKPAIEVFKNMNKNSISHAGPPIEWERMCGPMRGAVVATMIYEGLAGNWDEAERSIRRGETEFFSNHEFAAVGPMAGVISASMPVFVINDRKHRNTCYCRLVENKVQFGAFDKDAIEVLRFWTDILAPVLAKAVRASGGIDLKTVMARALHMGDELHNRPAAGTVLLESVMMPYLLEVAEKNEVSKVAKYFSENEIFFLCLSMGACKTMTQAAANIEFSTLVTVMARNGTDFGIQVSGLGNNWFIGPAGIIDAVYFPGFGKEDGNPDMGDSAITETAGVGGFALANSPAILSLIGGTSEDAIRYTKQMRQITMGLNETFTIPILNFQGTATGIDLRKVVRTGILPVIDTAVAHKKPGIGYIGAGLVNPPIEAFHHALYAFGKKYDLLK
jgi:Protein of unknown function (DUF1116)